MAIDRIPFTEIGVGGAIAVIIIREVLGFVIKQKKNGELVGREEFEKHKANVQYKENCQQIVKRLDDTNGMQEKRFDKIDKQFDEVKVLIKNNGR